MKKQVHCEILTGSPDAVHNLVNDFLEENRITRDRLLQVTQSVRQSTGELCVTLFYENE